MRKNCFAIILFVILVSCTKNEDPFLKIHFGNISESEFLKIMSEENVLIKKKNTFSDPMIVNIDSIGLDAIINPDRFDLNGIRQLKLELKYQPDPESTNILDFFGASKKDSTRFSKVLNQYYLWYGVPDSIYFKNNEVFFNGKMSESKIPVVKWDNKSHDLFIYSKGLEGNSRGVILYRQKNYEEEINKIKDSIKNNVNINSLVRVDNRLISCTWDKINNRKYAFTIHNINVDRVDYYDERSVKSVRLNFKITDEFNSELYTHNNITLQLEFPLKPEKYAYSSSGNEVNLKHTYYIYQSKDLEKTRKYAVEHIIKPQIEITALVLDDGSIVKK